MRIDLVHTAFAMLLLRHDARALKKVEGSGIEDASWQPPSLRVLMMHEAPSIELTKKKATQNWIAYQS